MKIGPYRSDAEYQKGLADFDMFQKALDNHSADPPAKVHPLLWQAQKDSLVSIRDEIAQALADYRIGHVVRRIAKGERPQCSAPIEIEAYSQWYREKRQEEYRKLGISPHKCSRRATVLIDGTAYCGQHAGKEAIRILTTLKRVVSLEPVQSIAKDGTDG